MAGRAGNWPWWRFNRWAIASEALLAVWWFIWGWTEPALVMGLIALGTAGYYLLTPRAKREMEDAAEQLAEASKKADRRR